MSNSSSIYAETVLTVIEREYGSLRHAAKILAGHAGASYRTAESWLSGRNVPSGKNLINLMNSCEALADELTRVVEESRTQKGN